MAGTIIRLSKDRPELADRSGVAMWPLPLIFPTLLIRCMALAQQMAVDLHLSDDLRRSERIAAVRTLFNQLVSVGGDVGEDHCKLFCLDHPDAPRRAQELSPPPPFWKLVDELARITDPIAFIGAMLRNEEGSAGEIEALFRCNFIKRGAFYEIHRREEPNHAKLATEIAEILDDDDEWRIAFAKGIERHDDLYQSL